MGVIKTLRQVIMISKPTLRRLVNRMLDDAETLLNNRRYAGCVYLSGYAVELSLKYRICRAFGFRYGYPETPVEFTSYMRAANNLSFLGGTIRSVRDLRIHDLNNLLFYSGEQLNIQTNFETEWNIISSWNVFIRYNPAIVRKPQALQFFNATRILIKTLL